MNCTSKKHSFLSNKLNKTNKYTIVFTSNVVDTTYYY